MVKNEIKSLSKFPTYVLFYSEIRPIMEIKCIVNAISFGL